MKNKISKIFFYLFLCFAVNCKTAEKKFVILISSYNNESFAIKNMRSAITQEYNTYRIIFINDCSSDSTYDLVFKFIDQHPKKNIVTLINNKERKLGLRNYYEAINEFTLDDEIIVCLDGDDFFPNKSVLSILNEVYSSKTEEIWLTYGQFRCLSNGQIGWNVKIPDEIIKNRDFRKYEHTPTHLRTFYSWLFKKIKKEDLLINGNFYQMSWDCAFMYPMLEMSGDRFKFINQVIYLYNDINPINDHKTNKELQRYYYYHIKSLKKYDKL